MSRTTLLRLLLLAQLLGLFLTPGQRELFVGDETKYGRVVREMRATHTFFLPTLQGTPFTHKPPLHFWLVDLLTFVFGVNSTWSFVLPSIAAFALLLGVMRRHGGELAAFVCGSSLMIWASAQSARMDVAFTALITLAAFLIERFFDRDDFRALLQAGALLGTATLFKGPMALVIALALFAFEWFRRRQAPRGNYLPAIAAMVFIPLLWTIPAMLIGGDAYTRDVVMKQTVGRAVGSWVHHYPPWYYLGHLPAIAFPWFFVALIAAIALWRGSSRQRFCISWIAAVLVPYSILSSKLDIYMMALLPPAALLVAELAEGADHVRASRLAHVCNVVLLALFGATGVVALAFGSRLAKGPEALLLALPAVRAFFIVLSIAGFAGAILAIAKKNLFESIVTLGLVPLIAFIYAAAVLMPLANQMASTRPLIASLERQKIPGENVALYWCPFLWSRDMPRSLESVHYPDAATLAAMPAPLVIVTSRAHSGDIGARLRDYRKVDELRMIGKWFDVYRR